MPIPANAKLSKRNMPSDLLRDLLIVNRRIFDQAVANVRAETNRDIDCVLREESLWAYEQTHRTPKSELQQINKAAQDRADRRVAEIQTAAASKIGALKTQHHERERRIRTYCDQLESQNQKPGGDRCEQPRLSKLGVPVPPKLAEIFGYAGEARFVGFYLEPTVDELMFDDGHTSATGEWYAFERWREHPAVAGHLQDVNLGGSDLDATHWLIIDRERDLLYVARVSTAQAFLQEQHPRPPERQPCETAEIYRRMQGQQRAVAEMLAFLDQPTAANHASPPESV